MSSSQTWQDIIRQQQSQPYFQQINDFVEQQRRDGKVVYPPENQVFSAFDMTPFEDVRVVILGQDPYHGAQQAHGLAFSVLPGVKIPPSLRNMYKELADDIEGFEAPTHGYLESWAQQGVLMLNTVLTVEEGKAHSHAKCGWETFTDHIIAQLNERAEPIVFLLWGAHAQKKGQAIDEKKHFVLSAPHPSPLSARRGFFGCKHFSQTNELLKSQNLPAIDWCLPFDV
ncbi:uracil-DNA glycosylase [Vibrio sp. Isolate30]|uniref:uracil-DNA glycosylase n=1 Tax=Vibrio sp. Isolate30 TaxID=2908536 RepID=UPI001EFCB197|nr:uracil-DNA glycosylase [Vibrio sp. Isolate30]MCG9631877.1 uracil-DNA glycosylase [Vibrio sp. Isolate30]